MNRIYQWLRFITRPNGQISILLSSLWLLPTPAWATVEPSPQQNNIEPKPANFCVSSSPVQEQPCPQPLDTMLTDEGKPEGWEGDRKQIPDAEQFRPFDPMNPPSLEPEPEPELLPELPPPEDLLRPVEPVQPEEAIPETPDTIVVERFEFVGNTAFSNAELAAVTAPFTGRPLTIDELYDARSAVTQRYLDTGYITSGAFIPPQRLQAGVVTMQIVEGRLDAIEVRGNNRLNASYIRRRIALGATVPLNQQRLLDRLRLLQLNPRIENLTAELSAGPQFGSSLLMVEVVEAPTFDVSVRLDNERSPSVGEFRQVVELSDLNAAGSGETINISYAHTDGSDALEGRFLVPLNARDGSVEINAGVSTAEIIEEPFDQLNIESKAGFVELTYRQPVIQTVQEELAFGVTASHQRTRAILDIAEEFGGPFPLTVNGADEDGVTRITALRFFQEWRRQTSRDVFALRSQFSWGLDGLDSTVNEDRPDSRFVAWRGQAQWVRLLAEDTLFFVRADAQLADDPLLTLERLGIGGQGSVRGYRRDLLLTDNGILTAAEVRLPLLRGRGVNGLLQVTPFVDFGWGWNVEAEDPNPQTLVGLGLGLLWRQDHLTARLDWGIPLVSVDLEEENTWQENGVYFSIVFNLR